MQSLNWLLNALAPPPPSRKSKKINDADDEILSHQPTHITPVVTAAPPRNPNALSQDDIQKLIRQLEIIQRNPKNSDAGALDLNSVKSLQTLINSNDGVQVLTAGTTGATARPATSAAPFLLGNAVPKDVELVTTVKPKLALPPVQLRPVPGIGDNDPLIRGNLITAAVNVTKAISGFLGSALQVNIIMMD